MRQNYHKFTVEGPRIVGELLGQSRYRIEHIYAQDDWQPDTFAPEVPLTRVSTRELGRISQLTTPNRVLAVVAMPPAADRSQEIKDCWSLYLDGVQSPNNLGALLRIADWCGFPYVFGGPGTADLYNRKSLQASMGSFLRVDYSEARLYELVAQAPELPVFGADLSGTSIYTLQPPPAGLLVVGAEGQGISEEADRLIDRRLTIPRAPGRSTESLNAAVAAGILMSWLSVGPRA